MNNFSKNRVDASLEELLPVISEKLEAGGQVAFNPYGESMLPLFVPGRDSVTLEKPQRPLKKNDILFYRRKTGQFVLHRLEKIKKDGSLVLRGDNQWAKEQGIRPEDILGLVVSFCQNGKEQTPNALKYKFYVRVLKPLHRAKIFVCLAVRKILRQKIYKQK